MLALSKNVNAIQYRVANEKVRFARFRPFPFGKGYMTHLFLVMMNDDFNISNCTVRTSENF